MGYRTLRVLNDDRVTPGAGFPTHGHRDMEIVSVVLAGALEHKDSLGTGSVIRPGDVQRMSAGSGIRHSEFNPSREEGARFLQIWILPDRAALPPSYEQKAFPKRDLDADVQLVASRDGRDGSVTVHQDVSLYRVRLRPGATATIPLAKGRGAWVQVAGGEAVLGEHTLRDGDGASVDDVASVTLTGGAADADVLVFDLA